MADRIPPQLTPFIRDTRYWTRRLRAAPKDGFSVVDEEPNRLVPFQFARVELKCLNTDGTADAYPLAWSDDASAYQADTTATVLKIRNFDGSPIGGLGKDTVTAGQNGTRLWVVHPMDRGSDVDADDTWEPLTPAGASFGSAHGTTSVFKNPGPLKIILSAAGEHTSDITLDSGGLKFANAGTYLIEAAACSVSGSGGARQELFLQMVLDHGGITSNVSDEFHNHRHGGSEAEVQGEVVIPATPVVVAAGDHVYLYGRAGTSPDAAIDSIELTAWRVQGSGGGSGVSSGNIDGGHA